MLECSARLCARRLGRRGQGQGCRRDREGAVKAGAIAAGMSEEDAEQRAARFASRSLRFGLATSAAIGGAAGHIPRAELFKDNAAAGFSGHIPTP